MASSSPAPDPGQRATRRPNYALRRLAVGGGLVAVAAAAVFVVWQRGDEGSDRAAGSGEWNAIVVADPRTGELTLFDEHGDELDRIDTGLSGTPVATGVDGVVAILDTAAATLGLVDLTSGAVTRLAVAGAATLVAVVEPGDPDAGVLVVSQAGAATSGDQFVVDVAARRVISAREAMGVDETLFLPDARPLVEPSGEHVALTELRSFQTALIDLGAATAELFPGAPLDVDDGSLLTLTGRRETDLVDLYDIDGERVGSAEVQPVAAAMRVAGSTALTVGRDGRVRVVDLESARVAERGTIAEALDDTTGDDTTGDDTTGDDGTGDGSSSPSTGVPSDQGDDEASDITITGGFAVRDRQRLLVYGDGIVAVIDRDAAVVGAVATPSPMIPLHGPSADDRCAVLAARPGAAGIVVDLDTGTQVAATPPGVMAGVSDDGCTVLVQSGSGATVIGSDGDIALDTRALALSPDATTVVVQRGARLALHPLDGGADVALGATSGVVLFVTR